MDLNLVLESEEELTHRGLDAQGGARATVVQHGLWVSLSFRGG